jgi:transcriptional regulator with XRE-family HTH domain
MANATISRRRAPRLASLRPMELAELGKRLQRAREDAGFKQADVAKELETDVSVISKWETGRQEMGVSSLARLCALYRVSTDYALGLAPHPTGLPVGKYLIRETAIRAFKEARSVQDFEDFLRSDPSIVEWAMQVHHDMRVASPAEWARLNDELGRAIKPHLPEIRKWWKRMEKDRRPRTS